MGFMIFFCRWVTQGESETFASTNSMLRWLYAFGLPLSSLTITKIKGHLFSGGKTFFKDCVWLPIFNQSLVLRSMPMPWFYHHYPWKDSHSLSIPYASESSVTVVYRELLGFIPCPDIQCELFDLAGLKVSFF